MPLLVNLDDMDKTLSSYIDKWQLTPDGDPFQTSTGTLQAVRYEGGTAFLKILTHVEEMRGVPALLWWQGNAVVNILRHDENAILMEKISPDRSLMSMAYNGHDDGATKIICETANKLHNTDKELPRLVTLPNWFAPLNNASKILDGVFETGRRVADSLLQSPEKECLLHGDLHHHNILDCGDRGWVAIDPKGVIGDHGFDYTMLFFNPDPVFAAAPGRLQRQLEIVSEESGIAPHRMLKWIVAYGCLSSAWLHEDGFDFTNTMDIVQIAIAELNR